MFSSFIITFREVLEIALIVGAVIGYLDKTNQGSFKKIVYAAVVAGVLLSFVGAVGFGSVLDHYHGTARLVFEGGVLIAGAVFIVGMLWWNYQQQKKNSQLNFRLEQFIIKEEKFGLFVFVLLSVVRDAMEIVVFLGATGLVVSTGAVVGAITGVVGAAACGLLVVSGIRRLPVKNIFRFTTIFLLLLALSLLINGLYELGEAGVLGGWMKMVS